MTKSFDSFRKEVLKTNTKKNFKIKNSYTVQSAYRWVKKNIWKADKHLVSEHDFRVIVKTINQAYADKLLRTNKIVFPLYMGEVEITKRPVKTRIINGKINTGRKINWKETLQLWYEDEEAKRNKVLVRHEIKESYKIGYRKSKAKFKNKMLINFSPIREIKIKLKEKINRGEADALLNGNNNELYKY